MACLVIMGQLDSLDNPGPLTQKYHLGAGQTVVAPVVLHIARWYADESIQSSSDTLDFQGIHAPDVNMSDSIQISFPDNSSSFLLSILAHCTMGPHLANFKY